MTLTPLRFTLGSAAALLLTGVASAQCPGADAFEPNDDCLTATAVTPGNYPGLTIFGPVNVGGENQDFYTINVPAGEIIDVNLTFATATGDIDLYLYDTTTPNCGGTATGDYLIRGFTGSDNESISWTNSTGAAEQYIIMVDAWDSDSDFDCNDYSMDIAVGPDPCVAAIDDSLEENDTCGAAVALGAGATAGLFTSTTDEDYYLVSVPAAEILTVDVSYTGATDVDLELFDDLACANQVDFSFSLGGTGTVTWTNTTGAAATLVMRAAPDATTGTCNNYDLNVATAPDPCQSTVPDAFEDNDDCATAAPVVDGLVTGLDVSKADEDFYEVSVADGDTLTVDIFFTDATADVDLYLYDDLVGCGDLSSYLVRGFSSTDDETVTWTNTSGSTATYYIQVVVFDSTFNGDCNSYDLQVTGSGGSVGTPMCAGDGSVAACPCGNESTLGAGEGCNHSGGVGATIAVAGSASVAADDISFSIAQAIANQPSLLVQGSVVVSVPFKDGLLCMGNPTERVEVVILDGNGEGTTSASIVTEGNVSAGDTRHYQFWYRNPGGISPCGSGSNFSSGLTVVYLP